MTVQERLQLLNYGYTKEQVDAMEQPAAQAPQVTRPNTPAPQAAQLLGLPTQVAQPTAPAPQVVQPTAPAEAPASDFLTTLTALGAMLNAQKAQPAAQAPTVAQPVAPAPAQQPAQPVAPAPVQLSPQQLTELIQGVAVQTASGTIETPPTAEQALLNMFSSVAGEVNKNEQN